MKQLACKSWGISNVYNVQTLKTLSLEEQKINYLELEKPVLDAFWCLLDTLEPLKSSAFGKAVTYARNQKPYIENYLLDSRCTLFNNAAENAIRPFIKPAVCRRPQECRCIRYDLQPRGDCQGQRNQCLCVSSVSAYQHGKR